MTGEFIAVDWGTTNRRAYLIDAAGAVVETVRDDRGILAVGAGGFAAEAEALRARYGRRPMLMAGMVGSNRGWHEVPYVGCPATIDDLARAAVWVEPGTVAIVPGVSTFADDRPDVMRGEEVQLLGAVAAAMTPDDALLCQPGTHCKWAWIKGGRIENFTTAMTGELFALLKAHSLLAAQLDGPVAANAEFLAGVEEARRGDLLASLFGVRAAAVLGQAAAGRGAAFVSGLLIGADVAARSGVAGGDIYLLADPGLGALYGAAINACGGAPHLIDSHAAFVAGIVEIWRKLP
ncbi:2-dehydro-3-deoxygalactonokinase [Sphingomonas cavernae]|uniref:2-dehydro-3-deoxygalactonokinase n=1 Tax=Sphingomonas cavernae TaxID=2320861 RepID=A0A418WKR3_9SPHN|nr:2-dehydro-3-deoxygalactonokinase [Sphingomonas cavernae]RJF90634.1 2-dehydro-3-deoxygalactonokinase [Sphingomonas cavernae]